MVAGIDEAGRGCLAGPVSVSLVAFSFLHFKSYLRLPLASARDSKKISARKRQFLASEIEKHASFNKTVFIAAKTIDAININGAIDQGIRLCLADLERTHLTAHSIILDGNRLDATLPKLFPMQKLQAKVRADANFFSVACASILSKHRRDTYMQELDRHYPLYHFSKNKGYPTLEHRKSLLAHGSCPEHRQSYRWQTS